MSGVATYQDYENPIAQVQRICSRFHIDSLKPQLAAIREVAGEGNVVNVALLGRFKSGKSSFLNSLLGKNILPVGVLPLTAVITRVGYGIEDKAAIRFLNGQIKNVAFDQLPDFITEERNPENIKKVARVDVELACLRDYSSIQLVDTPGLGSVHQHNTLMSKNWLPRVGAAFLAISVDHPLSQDDIALIKELENYTPETNILLTKIDLVSPEEAGRVVEFIRNQIRQQLNKDLRVFPFSNKPGYETARQAVSDFLRQSIGAQQPAKSAEIIRHKFNSIVVKCHEYLSLGLTAANSTKESRQELIRQIQHEREALLSIQNEIRLMANDLKRRLQEDASETFEGQHANVAKELLDQLNGDMAAWKGNLEKTSEAFRQWEETNFENRLKPLSDEHGPQLAEQYLKMAVESYSRVVWAFQDRLAQGIEKALHVQFPGAKFEVKIQEPQSPDVHIGNVFMTPWEILWFLIPMRIFRPMVNRHFVDRLPADVKVNLFRLASQWTEALWISIEDIAQQAKVFIQQEIDTVENLLRNAPDKQIEIEKAIAELDDLKTSLS